MAESTGIRVDLDVKERLENYRDQRYRRKTHSDTIAALMDEIESNDRARVRRMEEEANQTAYKESCMLDIGQEMKSRFSAAKAELGLRTDGAVIEFLLDHYEGSAQIGIGAFETYRRLKMANG